jgi:hypothetical protein
MPQMGANQIEFRKKCRNWYHRSQVIGQNYAVNGSRMRSGDQSQRMNSRMGEARSRATLSSQRFKNNVDPNLPPKNWNLSKANDDSFLPRFQRKSMPSSERPQPYSPAAIEMDVARAD